MPETAAHPGMQEDIGPPVRGIVPLVEPRDRGVLRLERPEIDHIGRPGIQVGIQGFTMRQVRPA